MACLIPLLDVSLNETQCTIFPKINAAISEIIIDAQYSQNCGDSFGILSLLKNCGGAPIQVAIPAMEDEVISGLTANIQPHNALLVDISPGVFNICGQQYQLNSPTTLNIGVGHATLPRIDTIYIDNTATPILLVGTPAFIPVAPTPPANTIVIAYVRVNAQASTVGVTFLASGVQEVPRGTLQHSTLRWNSIAHQEDTLFQHDGTARAWFGQSTDIQTPNGAGTRLEFLMNFGAFRVGAVTGTQWDVANVGQLSFAANIDTTASGQASAAFGEQTLASNINAFATGALGQATGINSAVFNVGCTASGYAATAFGNNNSAIGQSSFTGGEGCQAIGQGSFAMGIVTIANGYSACAVGYFTFADSFATAIGIQNTALGQGSFAGGTGSTAIGTASFAHGQACVAVAFNSVAFNELTQALGIDSFACGGFTIAGGAHSFAGGNTAQALNTGDFAFGDNAIANGGTATAFGTFTQALNVNSFAVGSFTLASGFYSFAGGLSSQATGSVSFAFGQSCIASNTHSTAFGDFTLASGFNSFACGSGAQATGFIGAFACNSNTLASGSNSFACGNGTIASANSAFSCNEGNIVSGRFSFGGGFGNAISSETSFCFSRNSICAGVFRNSILGGAFHTNNANSDSLCLGGLFHNILVGTARSVTIGGNGLTLNQNDTVFVPRFRFGGGFQVPALVFGGATLLLTLDHYLIKFTHIAPTGTLPAVPVLGQTYIIVRSTVGATITINGNGNNINGNPTYSLGITTAPVDKYNGVELTWDGTEWIALYHPSTITI